MQKFYDHQHISRFPINDALRHPRTDVVVGTINGLKEPDPKKSDGSVEAPPENFHTLYVLNSINRTFRYN
jgi:hypothetical protein